MLNKVAGFVKGHLPEVLSFGIIFLFLILNAVHTSYPDEFDNIAGGWNILHGILPWSGFFSHHGALAYFFAAVIDIFSGQNFVKFRFFSALFYLLVIVISYVTIKKQNTAINTEKPVEVQSFTYHKPGQGMELLSAPPRKKLVISDENPFKKKPDQKT